MIMTKISKLKFVLFFFLCFYFYPKESNWTLACQKFKFSQKTVSITDDAVCSVLPVLIMEQISSNLVRNIDVQEKLDRKLYELNKSRVSLFLQLSKEVQKRDSLVLEEHSQKKLKILLNESNLKIKEIEDKITENLNQCKKEKETALVQINNTESNNFINNFNIFSSDNEYSKKTSENIVFYKNDYNKLYEVDKKLENLSYDDLTFSNAVTSSGINGLITGVITKYGDYISVAINVYQYPSGRLICSGMEVGLISDLKTLSYDIANDLILKITKNLPIELQIKVTPKEALNNLVITIDDLVITDLSQKIVVSSGVHSVSFSSKGYTSLFTNYSFTENSKYLIEVNMTEEKDGLINLRLNNMFQGQVYSNGNYYGLMDENNRVSSIKINNNSILGRFITEDGLGSDFYLPPNLIVPNAYYKVNPKPFDRSEYIEKRRKYMYASYSGLILSLIPYFYIYGNYHSMALSYNAGSFSDYTTAKNWKIASDVSMGVSIGCAAVFIYELVRYLYAANTVIPETPKKLTEKELLKLDIKNNTTVQNNMEAQNE